MAMRHDRQERRVPSQSPACAIMPCFLFFMWSPAALTRGPCPRPAARGTTASIKNLNLTLAPGDVLGVMGPSGAGKSTLARLLVGVWPAGLGQVRLDGADLYQWNKSELGTSVGYLPQDIELFSGTVGENIARFGHFNSE